MKRHPIILAAAATVLLVAVAAGCGDTDEVPADAVAVVDGTTITKDSLNELLARAKKSYAAQKRQFPKTGTTDYQALQAQAVAYLVQREEYAHEADTLGVKVTDAQIAKQIDDIRKQYFSGDEKKFQAGLEEQGYTLAALREDARANLVSQGIYKDLTDGVKVTDAEVRKYYDDNIDKYKVAESRDVRHILVKTKAEADQIHAELVAGADFAQLAQQHSIDPGSKDQGGKLTITKGQTVAPFDKVAFSLATNKLSEPVKTQYGYHLIQPLGDVKPGSVTPFAQVKDQIQSQLLESQKSSAVSAWASKVEKEYDGKVSYADGFEPPETSTTTGAQLTTDG